MLKKLPSFFWNNFCFSWVKLLKKENNMSVKHAISKMKIYKGIFVKAIGKRKTVKEKFFCQKLWKRK